MNVSDDENRKYACAVVPVLLQVSGRIEKISTYAALDTRSTSCFLNETLLTHLGVAGRPSTLTINTMGSVESRVKTKVLNNLIVRDVDGVERDTLPVVFSQQRWPINEDDASDSDLYLKNVLKDSPFQMIGKKINLIIGINRPDILKPRELIKIPNSRSYLTRHSIGWALKRNILGRKKAPSC